MSFRRSAGGERSRRGRGSRGTWRNRWRPPQAEVGTPAVLIPGEYPDPRPDKQEHGRAPVRQYFLRSEHRKVLQKGKSIMTGTCSAGWDPNDACDCVWCYEKENGDSTIDNGKDPRLVFSMNLVHLVWFHLVPDVDRKTKRPRINEKTGKPYMVKTECQGRGCPHCKNDEELTFGAKKYMDVGLGHLGNLRDFDATVGRLCLRCREGTISTASFECPECGEVIVDCLSHQYTDRELDQFATEQLTCPNPQCRTTGMAVETIECSHCKDPLRTTLFDVVFWMCRKGEGTDSKISLAHDDPRHPGWCFLDEFDIPCDPPAPLITGWEDDETGLGLKPVWDEDVRKLTRPFDFAEMMDVGKPLSLDGQAKRLQVQNPFAQTRGARSYGDGPGFNR